MELTPPSYQQASAPSYQQSSGPQQSQHVVYTNLQPIVYGPHSAKITCPSCHSKVDTNVVIENSSKTHLIALILCIVCFCCVWVPYCNDSCKAKNHYCPNCGAYLGTYEN